MVARLYPWVICALAAGCNFQKLEALPDEEIPLTGCETNDECPSGRTCVQARCLSAEEMAALPSIEAVTGEAGTLDIVSGSVTLTGANLQETNAVELLDQAGSVLGAFNIVSKDATSVALFIGAALEVAIRADTSTTQTIRLGTPTATASFNVLFEPGAKGPTGGAGLDPVVAGKVNSFLAGGTCPSGQLAVGLMPTGALLCEASTLFSGLSSIDSGTGVATSTQAGVITVGMTGAFPQGLAITHSSSIASPQLAVEATPASPPVVRLEQEAAPAGAHWEIVGDVQNAAETAADATLTFRYVASDSSAIDAMTVTGDGRLMVGAASTTTFHYSFTENGFPMTVQGDAAGPLATITQQNTAGEALRVRGRSELLNGASDQLGFAANAGTTPAIYAAANAARLPIYRVQESTSGTTRSADCLSGDILLGGGCQNEDASGVIHLKVGYPVDENTFTCTTDATGALLVWAVCLKSY